MGHAYALLSFVPGFIKHLVKVFVLCVADGSVCALVFQPLLDVGCIFIQASNIVKLVIFGAIEVLMLCAHNYSPVEVNGFIQIVIVYLFVNICCFDKIQPVD